MAGAVLGLLLAAGTSQVFRALASDLPRIEEIGLNGSVVLYSLSCAVAGQQALMPDVISWCTRHGFRFSPRLHILVWGPRRGV